MSAHRTTTSSRLGRVIAAIAVLALAVGALLAWTSTHSTRAGRGTAVIVRTPTAAATPPRTKTPPMPRTPGGISVLPSVVPTPPNFPTGTPAPGGIGGTGGPHIPAEAPVVHANLTGPVAYQGVCPATLEYSATVTVDPAATSDVTYNWNDGTASGAATVHLVHGTATITRTVTLSESGSGSVQLQVISPATVSSNTRSFRVECIGDTAGTASTTPLAYTGDCSRRITFTTTAAITVTNGPAAVTYRWLRSDGAPSAVQTVDFGPGTSTQSVSTTWSRSLSTGPERGWEQLEILTPVAGHSNQSAFSLWCV
jgi:hypothetical protein